MLKQRLQHIIAALLIMIGAGLVLAPAIAGADALKNDACSGINQLDGTTGSNCSTAGSKGINNVVSAVINILSVIVGFVAVIMLIVAGLRYITANGDSNAAASARSGIVYALIGLVIVASAQILVHFVLKNVKA